MSRRRDVTIQAQIMNLLKELQQETGMAMILITHDIGSWQTWRTANHAGQMIEGARSPANAFRPAGIRLKSCFTIRSLTQALLDTVPTIRDDADRQLVSIPGIVPDDIGCRFADRCRVRMPARRCRSTAALMSRKGGLCDGGGETARCIVMKNRWKRADESEKQKSQQR